MQYEDKDKDKVEVNGKRDMIERLIVSAGCFVVLIILYAITR